MTEKVLAALDAITARVLSYRPKDKGLAAKKTERRLKRQANKEANGELAAERFAFKCAPAPRRPSSIFPRPH
jgi:hypothetical protein